MKRGSVQFRRIALFTCVILGAGFSAPAQTPAPPPANAGSARALPPQQLDNLVAPVALYPDPLLGEVLAASTYPVELVEAQQWLLANPGLQGQQLMDAARQQNWDPSVQALVAMPNVLSTLTQDIRWTTDLGNAFLAQQGDVMSAVQRMRQRAQANGQLQTTPQETVTDQDQGGQSAIEIQPAVPDEIYVPSYDPYYVYGYGDYPPLYYPDGYWFEPGIDVGLYFGGWGGWGYGGWGWGWGCNWFGGGLFVNTGFFNRYGFRTGYGFAGGISGRTPWVHNPAHRLGAGYPDGRLTSRFGAASQASRIAAGRSGNWHSFGEGNIGGRNSFLPAAQARGAESFRGSSNAERFGGGPSYRAQAPARGYSSPAREYASPERGYASPGYRSPSYAPQRSFQSAPRMSAPSYGGGARSFGGGGGARSFGGGGSRGGGGHGGGRR